MIVPFEPTVEVELAKTRVTSQFSDKPIFNKYVELLSHEFKELSSVLKDLLQLRDIDTAAGKQLDIIGRIVGQDRELISTDLFDFFGFQGEAGSKGFGDLEELAQELGGYFYDLGTPVGSNVLLDDETYRIFIKAKILKNTTASTPDQFITIIGYLFNSPKIFLTEGEAEYTILFGRQLSRLEIALLKYVTYSQGYASLLIPKTVGVRVNFGYFEADDFFGFEDVPDAKGFGEATYRLYDGVDLYDGEHTHNFTLDDAGGGIFAGFVLF